MIYIFSSGSSDPSSEDKPLINLMKKRQAQSKVKTPAKKDTCPRRLEEKHVTGRDTGMKFGNIVNKSEERLYGKASPSSDSSSDVDDISLCDPNDKTKRRGNFAFTIHVVNLTL